MGFEAVRNWWGRSFWVCGLLEMAGAIGRRTCQRDLALAALLDTEHERLLQSTGGIRQGKEGLVWSLRSLSVDGCEVELQRVGGAQRHGLREGMCSAEPGESQSVKLNALYVQWAHLFLAAPPTPAPLLAMATVASSKLHAAADAIDAPESKSEDTKPKETFMIDVCKRVNAELSSDARGQLSCVASRARGSCGSRW